MATDILQAYHFVGATLRDGRPVPPDGVWLAHDGPLVLCRSGIHASVHPFDALTYAPGPILCRVELAGQIVTDTDKVVAQRRRIVARIDATALLRDFARASARDVLPLWDAPAVVAAVISTPATRTIRAASARAAAWARDAAAAAAAASAAAATRTTQRHRFAALVDAAFAEAEGRR